MLVSLLLLASTATASHQSTSARTARHNKLINERATASFIDSNATPGTFEIVGNSGVSAQMMFLGTKDTVYILDKAENNSMTVTTNGVTHPAWGTSYDLLTNVATPMEVTSNTFCAAGAPVANGSWVVFGGNQRVTYGGAATNDTTNNPTGANPYLDVDGGAAIRVITPCDDESCLWAEGGAELTMTSNRWYPSVEGLADGSLIVLGGDNNGGYVSTFKQNNPTYEYWPRQSSNKIAMSFLNETVPINLYPLTWLLPSGKLFLQAAYKTILYDMDTKVETPLQDMPYAQRVYPASAAAVMLPLTPANNYSATILFCGGSAANLSVSDDGGAHFNVTAVVADQTCVRISPDDAEPTYSDDDSLPEPRSMGQLIYLPDGTMWLGNGVGTGTAGYGDEKLAIGQSYGQNPVYMPAIYDPTAPKGSRFSRTGLEASTEERMYHSSAILLSDGAVLVSGSNPNKDFTTEKWATKYSVEKWYPPWYNQPRPVPSGFPSSLSYGGDYWTLKFTNASVDPSTIKVNVVRTGFSTHCINFGQRYLELETSYSMNNETGEVTVFVSQMPPNPNIFTPGPAMIFLVVNGVPSQGEMILIGSGEIETQSTAAASVLPQSEIVVSGSTEAAATGTVAATGVTLQGAANAKETSGASLLSTPVLAVILTAMASIAWM